MFFRKKTAVIITSFDDVITSLKALWIATICCNILTVISIFCVISAFAIAKVVIGITHHDDCIIRPSIPIYIIISGVIEILIMSFMILPVQRIIYNY